MNFHLILGVKVMLENFSLKDITIFSYKYNVLPLTNLRKTTAQKFYIFCQKMFNVGISTENYVGIHMRICIVI